MNIKKKGFSNTVYQLIGKAVTAASTLLVTVLITRSLGAQVFGEYSVVITYVLTFFLVADFGVNAIITKEFAKDEQIAKENFVKVLGLRIAIGMVLLLLAAFLLVFIPYQSNIKIAILIALPIIIFQSILKASSVLFQAYLKYYRKTLADSLGAILSLVLVYLLSRSGHANLANLAIVYVFGGLITAVAAVFLVKKYLNTKSRWIDYKYWKYTLLDAFPLGMALMLNVFMVHADRFLLSVMSSYFSVGIYSLAYKIFDVVLVIPTFFMNAMFPILISAREASISKYRSIAIKTVGVMTFLAILMTIPSIMLSKSVISAVWGSDMARAYLPLNILMLGGIAFFVTSPLSWLMVIENKQKKLPILYGVAFAANIVLNIIFIPRYDYVASAVITVITEVFVLLFLLYYLRGLLFKGKKSL